MKIITVYSLKGGSAKSTSSLNLSKALNILGKNVLMIDLDAQANLSQSVGFEDEEFTIADVFSSKLNTLPIKQISDKFDIVPASLELSIIEPRLYANVNSYFLLKNKLEAIKLKYDFVVIDCPPSAGIYTQNALIACDSVIVTVQAHYFSLKGLDTVQGLLAQVKESLNEKIEILGILLTQTNHTKLNKDIIKSLREVFSERVFRTTIRQNVALAEASSQKKSIFDYKPQSNGAQDYLSLAKEILYEQRLF